MDYQLIDADNHYYEAEDCFTRYGDDEVKRFVRWVAEGKRRYILFGGSMQTMVPNPTFNPVIKPGVLHKQLKELAAGGGRERSGPANAWSSGSLEPLQASYRDRDARLQVMDEQGLEKAWLFPTLAVGIEGLHPQKVELTYKLFHAFNLWLEDDWGWGYKDRLLGAAAIPVLDPVLATKELDFVLDRGAKLIVLRPGPANGRSRPIRSGTHSGPASRRRTFPSPTTSMLVATPMTRLTACSGSATESLIPSTRATFETRFSAATARSWTRSRRSCWAISSAGSPGCV